MLDSTDLVKIIKQAAVEAVTTAKPVDVLYGTVTSTSPLTITTDQKMLLGELQLALVESLTDRTVGVEIEGEQHTVTLRNRLKTGEKVLLIRRQQGQQYVIVDRVV